MTVITSKITFFFVFTLFCISLAKKNNILDTSKYKTAHEMIEAINKHDLGWKADPNLDNVDLESFRGRLGVLPSPAGRMERIPVKLHKEKDYTSRLFNSIEKTLNPQSSSNELWRLNEDAIPSHFDARTAFPECADMISSIRDQSVCGSCWSVAVAAAISDRICIHTKGHVKVQISSSELTTCCGEYCGEGCNGGWPSAAWDYWVRKGLVTGGEYDERYGSRLVDFPKRKDENATRPPVARFSRMVSGVPDEMIVPSQINAVDLLRLPSQQALDDLVGSIRLPDEYLVPFNVEQDEQKPAESCWPYEYEPCEHHMKGERPECNKYELLPTPGCRKNCVKSYNKNFMEDKHYGRISYRLPNRVEQIQLELMKHGPLTASFTTYSDFSTYKSGVYQATSKKILGGHAMKLIGWGEENGTPYWLFVNSWNSDWGDNGYVKILRGANHCQIEESILGGIPKESE